MYLSSLPQSAFTEIAWMNHLLKIRHLAKGFFQILPFDGKQQQTVHAKPEFE
jgi:hypothetical protein